MKQLGIGNNDLILKANIFSWYVKKREMGRENTEVKSIQIKLSGANHGFMPVRMCLVCLAAKECDHTGVQMAFFVANTLCAT